MGPPLLLSHSGFKPLGPSGPRSPSVLKLQAIMLAILLLLALVTYVSSNGLRGKLEQQEKQLLLLEEQILLLEQQILDVEHDIDNMAEGDKQGPPCVWKRLVKNHVWVDTLGNGTVQMGYISAVKDEYPNILPSGQPNVTALLCKHYCDALGPNVCAAAQFYECEPDVAAYNWCDLLTPTEFSTSYSATDGKGVLIHPQLPIFVGKINV